MEDDTVGKVTKKEFEKVCDEHSGINQPIQITLDMLNYLH